MKESSARLLPVLSLIFLVLGFMILSPDGRLVCLVPAGLASAAVLIRGGSWIKRSAALIVLVIVALQLFSVYPEYKASMDAYKKNALKHNGEKTGPVSKEP